MLASFKNVQEARPPRSTFDLSHRRTLTCDMGQLIPTFVQEVVPGDSWKLGNEIVLRFQPMVAPMMHEVYAYIHYFFVPYRLLWDDWEQFITGGVDGEFEEPVPTWTVSGTTKRDESTLWDYLGFPTGVTLPVGYEPIDFPRRAYNFIYNEYYRDETLQTELVLDGNEDLQNRCWEKDYFTSALPWQQRGTAPAMPVSGTTNAAYTDPNLFTPATGAFNMQLSGTAADTRIYTTNSTARTNLINVLNSNVVDFSDATTFDIADLRLAFQLQRWLERNARGGVRYTEFLQMHFGVRPQDSRLQRPEYIGGFKTPIIISEVLQTSETATSPQGTMAGHGITADSQFCGRYFAQEYGLIMGIMSIMPKGQYQQGLSRQWQRRTKFDFYNPTFANLSEQAITRGEIYATAVLNDNNTIFGYQGIYDELRYVPSTVHGQMKSTYDYWHMGRIFSSAPALNSDFVKCNPTKRIFAAETEPGCIVHVGNRAIATRPMPIVATPGGFDRN